MMTSGDDASDNDADDDDDGSGHYLIFHVHYV